MAQKLIIMAQKELSRHEIIKNLVNGSINGSETAIQLDLSVRQTKRPKAKMIKLGVKGLAHAGRGAKSLCLKYSLHLLNYPFSAIINS